MVIFVVVENSPEPSYTRPRLKREEYTRYKTIQFFMQLFSRQVGLASLIYPLICGSMGVSPPPQLDNLM